MASNDAPRIVWTYDSRPDFLTGADATPLEGRLTIGAALVVPLVLAAFAWPGLGWAWWQWLLALVFAADIAGGVVSNALNAQKRAMHAPVRPSDSGLLRAIKRWPVLFPLVHIHPFVIAAAYGGDLVWVWVWAAVWYLVPVATVAALGRLPLYLHRPVAFTVWALSLAVAVSVLLAPAGWGWFAPMFVAKLVCAHAVREEPYAPPAAPDGAGAAGS
jgi:hypothetical protein